MKNTVAATASLGPVKKTSNRRSKNRNIKSFKKKVKKYLKADCFLYAPLVSDLPLPSTTLDSSAAAGALMQETSKIQQQKKKKNKSLLERIMEYLQSNSHMYASFVDAKKSPASGPVQHFEKLSITISRRITTEPHVDPTPDRNITVEDTNNRACQNKRQSVKQRAVGRYRPSSASGAMSRELRRLVA